MTNPTSTTPADTAPGPQPPWCVDDGPWLTEAEILALTHPRIREALDAFNRDLPDMMKDHQGQWVAYHGVHRLGCSQDKTELYQRCMKQGYAAEELLVTVVDPRPTVWYI